MKNNIYFDVAATTPIDLKVIDIMNEINSKYFGNPSSIHFFGQKTHNIIEKSRKLFSEYLGCLPSEIVFTSGGTESNNIALNGILNPGDHFITSSYEHPAILNVAKNLELKGINVTYVKPCSNGIISASQIKEEICDKTRLVSIMALNNELGTINPIHEISEICKSNNVLFHSDAVQLIGKRKFDLIDSIDLLSIGAHKFYGPKGIGALYIKKGTVLNPFIIGGGQENGFRPGTENIALIAGMTEALKISFEDYNKNCEHIQKLENLFFSELDKTAIQYNVNGSHRLSGIINITFDNFDGQTLLMNLDMNGIAISYGSACSSGTSKPSSALLEIGLTEQKAKNTVRISIGKFINVDDIKYLVATLEKIICNSKVSTNV
tara:strand:+ start:363 stop:1496 length:1134 start_codon:yes stop_codon:yes gene_type:complete